MSEQDHSSFSTWLAKVLNALDLPKKLTLLLRLRGKLLGKLFLLKDVYFLMEIRHQKKYYLLFYPTLSSHSHF